MNILAIDTALGACSAAVIADDRVLSHEHREMDRGHAEALAPMVEALMRAAAVSFAALDRIAVTTGPGTFTGQRVGLAFARALGLALKKPVIGVTTLDVMAGEALAKTNAGWAIAVADAKRGEVYLGARSAAHGAVLVPELIPIAAVAERIVKLASAHDRTPALAGTAAEIIKPLLEVAGLAPLDSLVRQPDAIFVAKLAKFAPEGRPPKPLYLRAPDARLPGALL